MTLRRHAWLPCIVCAVLLLTAAQCDTTGSTSTSGAPAGGGAPASVQPPPGVSECSTAGGRAGALLPSPTTDFGRLAENPCVPLASLAGAVLDLVPESDPDEPAIDKKAFRSRLGVLTKRVLTVDALAQCAYQTDRLAVGLYRQSGHGWSVGMVAVIRGDIDAAAAVAICFVLDQLPRAAPTQSATPGPHWEPASTPRAPPAAARSTRCWSPARPMTCAGTSAPPSSHVRQRV